MAMKVKSPSKIRLRTNKMMIRSTKPRIEQNSHNDTDSTWKRGLESGTSLDNYRLDVMKLK